jgi:cyclase
MRERGLKTLDWLDQVQQRGAGEIVLNCMASDGTRNGFDLPQLAAARERCTLPLIASGGAGCAQHFIDVFRHCDVDGALAAGIFHRKLVSIPALKQELAQQGITIRL